MKFTDLVTAPELLMGVKAVYAASTEPVMCFGARGDATLKTDGFFTLAETAAKEAATRPYLVTIGGGQHVDPQLAGRVVEVATVSMAFGETRAFVRDVSLQAWLSQWPVAVVLLDVFEVVGRPHLVGDLGFPNLSILSLAFDRVLRRDDDIEALWRALAEWPIRRNVEVIPLPDFDPPTAPRRIGTYYPKVRAAEGKARIAAAKLVERDSKLAALVKDRNRESYGQYTCEACLFADSERAMFDAHHLYPLAKGPRFSEPDNLVVLCPTCHRWAHAKSDTEAKDPLPLPLLRQSRRPATAPASPSIAPAPAPSPPPGRNS